VKFGLDLRPQSHLSRPCFQEEQISNIYNTRWNASAGLCPKMWQARSPVHSILRIKGSFVPTRKNGQEKFVASASQNLIFWYIIWVPKAAELLKSTKVRSKMWDDEIGIDKSLSLQFSHRLSHFADIWYDGAVKKVKGAYSSLQAGLPSPLRELTYGSRHDYSSQERLDGRVASSGNASLSVVRLF